MPIYFAIMNFALLLLVSSEAQKAGNAPRATLTEMLAWGVLAWGVADILTSMVHGGSALGRLGGE